MNPHKQVEALRPLLAVIRKHEGTYTSVNRGAAGDTPGGWPQLTSMTLGAVRQAQERGEVFAVGAYQFIPDTLQEVMEQGDFSPMQWFSPSTQDLLAAALILGPKRPALRDYLLGRSDDRDAAQDQLAYEWASLPNSRGVGWYDGDSAGNRAHVPVKTVQMALKTARTALVGQRTSPRPARPEPQFYTQRDNGPQSERSCFSASCAMLLKRVKPKALSGSNADMDYLEVVNRYGDTTDPAAQIKALREYGVTARLVTNGTVELIREQVDRWGGIALGWIHRGPVTRPDPACNGHWLFCFDVDDTHLRVHDPYGEAALVSGGFIPGRSGRDCSYSIHNFSRRWEVVPQWRYAPGNGWAVVVDGVT